MDYSDTTVIIPIKDEPAVSNVAAAALKALPGCKALVIYKGALNARALDKKVRVVRQTSSGKGMACVEAGRLVKTPIMCFIDGDGTYDPSDLKELVGMIREGADLALGNRFARITEGAMPFYVRLGNGVLTGAANILYGLRIGDSQTGLRAIRTKVFNSLGLKEKGFAIEEETNIKAKKMGCKIAEAGASYYPRASGETKQSKLLDGMKLLLINFKFLFG